MNILAIDTALAACSVGLLVGGRPVQRCAPMARGHAEALMPLLADAMGEAGIGYADIDRFAVTVGPGTFTGVRVGVATVRGLALVTGRPAIAVTTLEAIAASHRARDADTGPLVVAMDARRDQAYAQAFAADGAPLDEPRVVDVATLARTFPGAVRIAVGTAAATLAEAAAALGRDIAVAGAYAWPDPLAVARIALDRTAGPPPSPLYLRPPDARPQSASRLARA